MGHGNKRTILRFPLQKKKRKLQPKFNSRKKTVPTWRQLAEWRAGASGDAVEPGCDPLWVRAGKQLRGRLSELQDLGQHGDPLVRVLDAAQ